MKIVAAVILGALAVAVPLEFVAVIGFLAALGLLAWGAESFFSRH